ncbi:MAG TPA: hypothetical protein VFX98_13335 [Longimicrobiaceae bacterium]|nr:hypothetical protein [Longimicrobiaceae bacterium]
MPTPLRAAFTLCAMFLAAGCAREDNAAPGAAAPAGRLAPAAWTPDSNPDAIAEWARAGCGGVLTRKRECYERALLSLLEPAGVATTMAVLDRLVQRDAGLARQGHALAHGIGIAAYRDPGTVGKTFAACGPTQMSGCYHGVIQGYFLDVQARTGSVGAAALNAVCEEQRRTRFLFFQCSHGLGHGLMALHGNDLPRALEACDRVEDGFMRESCYGGAFMENIVHATNPHHTAAAHAALDPRRSAGGDSAGHAHPADGGHDHHAAADTPRAPFKALDRGDPLYPCTAVADKYHLGCYYMQTSAILHMFGNDVAFTARACDKAPPRMVRVCYMSLGRDITALAQLDHGRALELCARGGPRGEAWCLEGVAENLVNVAADAREGLRFCARVARAGAKPPCYLSVGDMLGDIEPDSARREEVCAGAEAAFVETCRRGARLPAPPAAGAER